MKRFSLYIASLFAALILLPSCLDENEVRRSADIEEGLPVSLNLPFVTGDADVIETKSALTDGNVIDLYVLVFDKNGNRVEVENSYFPDLSGTSGRVTINTTTGLRRIYGVANIGAGATMDIKTKLDAVDKETELQSLPVSLSSNIVSFAGNSFLTSGYFTSGKEVDKEPTAAQTIGLSAGTGDKGIITNEEGSAIEGSIKLIRLFSNVTFNISIDPGKVTSFQPTSWKVVNVPGGSALYTAGTVTGDSYFATEESERFYKIGKSVDSYAFEFAMLENLKSKKGVANANARENEDVRPANATYIVLEGHYVGTGKKYDEQQGVANENAKVEANVTYFISLGQGAGMGANDLGDYKSERNKLYTYNVKVAGVDQVITEVIKKDPYHRADGNVTYTEGDVCNVDAHYESLVFTFSRADVQNFSTDFQVKTPFSSGYVKFSDSKKSDANYTENWNWVHFMVNKVERGEYSDNKEHYPGDQSASLMNVETFQSYLQTPENYRNDKLKVTCFVDEFYYDSKNWTEFVNTDPRVMQILCTTKDYTHNGNHTSSLMEARYTISQKSIQTIYSLDPTRTAWGIEWVNETSPLSSSASNSTTEDLTNGLKNMTEKLGTNTSWYGTTGFHNSAIYSCMSRNRDDNGDVAISKDEIKWYLPAIYQYMDIWMGTFGLPNGFPLYQGTGASDYQHFASSSNKRSPNDTYTNYILWAEEGSSFGLNNDGYIGSPGRKIRCIRNLGMPKGTTDYPDQYYEVDDNLVFNLSRMNSKSIRSQYIPEGELAAHTHTDFNGGNTPYKKFQFAKDIVRGFPVKYRAGGEIVTLRPKTDVISRTELEENIRLNNSPCKYYSQDGITKGWRLPCQRELQMYIRKGDIPDDAIYTWTEYAFTADRVYALAGNLYLTTDPLNPQGGPGYVNPSYNIRCVRDVE